jgi:hypothetical protein
MYYVGFLCYGIAVIALLQGSWESVVVAVGFAAAGTGIWIARNRLDKTSLDDLRRELKEGISRNPDAILDIGIGGNHLVIAADEIRWRGKTLPTSQISGIRVRNENININLVDFSQRQIKLTGPDGSMTIDCAWGAGVDLRSRVLFEQVLAAVWKAACVPLLARWQQRLAAGEAITVGNLTVVAGGLMLRGGLTGFKPVFAPWADLTCTVKSGRVSLLAPNASSSLSIWRVENAILIPTLVKVARSLPAKPPPLP